VIISEDCHPTLRILHYIMNNPKTVLLFVLYLIIWREPFDVLYTATAGKLK
jgi:hypothetical protein